MANKPFKIGMLLVVIILMAGCGAQPTPEPTPTPQPSATVTTPPTATATSTHTPTATLQPTPTDQTGCTDRAEFVADVTVPDNMVVGPGEAFTKTWRIKNMGSCTWNARYQVVFLKGDQMGAPAGVSFGSTEIQPGQPGEFSIELVAPTQNGTYTGIFQFEDPAGQRFGVKDGNIWVKIVVRSGGANETPSSGSTPISTATTGTCSYSLNADFINQVLTLINQARGTYGLTALTVNAALSTAAQIHSQDMACNNFISHTGSDGSTEETRIAAQGYQASRTDEVIFAAFPDGGGDPATVVNWWMNDANHRAVLLAADLTEFGAGYAFTATSGAGGYYTVNFAKP